MRVTATRSLRMTSSGYTPSDRKLGFVIRGVEKYAINDYLEGVAAIIGAENIRTFGRIKGNFGIWVKTIEAAGKLSAEDYIVVNSENIPIWPYVQPILKVKLFNVPPFVTNEAIEAELNNHGAVKAKITVEPLYGVSDKFKGIESFTRITSMTFESEKKLPGKLIIKTEESSHTIFTQVGRQKCFICQELKHKSSACPRKKTKRHQLLHLRRLSTMTTLTSRP